METKEIGKISPQELIKLKIKEGKEPVLIDGGLSVDDRGSVTFINNFNFEGVKRMYMVENHRQGFLRSWHSHQKEGKYVCVVNGTILLGVVGVDRENDIIGDTPQKFILSSRKPQILYIPPKHANGFKNLTDDVKVIFFSTSTLEESLNDDERFSYNYWDIWQEDFR